MPEKSIDSFFIKSPANAGTKRKAEESENLAAKKSKADVTSETAVDVGLVNGEPVVKETKVEIVKSDNVVATSTSHWTQRLAELMPESWRAHLEKEFKKPYFSKLCKALLDAEVKEKQLIFPPHHEIFSAFDHTPFDNVKVCIIGQDPYHDNNQAHGMCFSVRRGITIPPSLRNIYKELSTDIDGFVAPKHGNLIEWADQGVLLLNTTLTVKAHAANSHQKYGWLEFTDAVITAMNKDLTGVVFILWGAPAQKKADKIDQSKHAVIKGVHPSPLSAARGFFGSKPFSQCNEQLKKFGKKPIDWKLSP